eukprot:316389-Prymnesium_polylepis.1
MAPSCGSTAPFAPGSPAQPACGSVASEPLMLVGSCASDSPRHSDVAFDVQAELASLRAQLAEEREHRTAWMAAIADQREQLQHLADQQALIVHEMRRFAEYTARCPPPA